MFLDIDKGVAHNREDCPGYVEANFCAEGEEPIGGFTYCADCGNWELVKLKTFSVFYEVPKAV